MANNNNNIVNHTPMIYSTVDTCITPRDRALWSGASVDDITIYKQYVDLYLDSTYQLSHYYVKITTVITHTLIMN